MKSKNLSLFGFGLIACILAAPSAFGQTTYTWANGAANGSWSTAANWNPAAVPTFVAGDTFDLSTLNITAARSSLMDTSNTLGTVLIGDSGTASNSWSLLLTGTLTLDGSTGAALIRQTATSVGDTISGAGGIQLASALNLDNNDNNTLTISAGITAATAGTKTISNLGTGTGPVTISGAIGIGAGDVAVTQGSPTSTLNLTATNAYTGVTTINAGILHFGRQTAFYNGDSLQWTAANLVVGSGGTASFAVGGTNEFIATSIDTIKDLGTATGGFLSGSRIGFNTANAAGGNFSYSSAIANTNGGANVLGVVKLGNNTLTLSGNNTYTGPTAVSTGTLAFAKRASFYNGDTSKWTAANLTVASGATAAFQVGGVDEFAAADLDLIKALGDGTGGFLAGSRIGVDTTNAVGDFTYGGVFADANGGIDSLGLVKRGTGTLVLTQPQTYTGATIVTEGVLKLAASASLAPNGAVTVGTGTTVGSFDLSDTGHTIESNTFTVTSNSSSANTVTIGAAKTLTVNGNVTIGVNGIANSTTVANFDGGGSLVVGDGVTPRNFIVGGAVMAAGATAIANNATADLSGLSNFTANLTQTGVFRVGDNTAASGNNSGGSSTVNLPPNNTITANIVGIGYLNSSAGHTLVLGSGTNVLNTNTVNVGGQAAFSRGTGVLRFDPLDTTGTVTLRAANGTGRTAFNLRTDNTNNVTTGGTNVVDFNGHVADLLISTLNISSRGQGGGSLTGIFSFNQGKLDATTVTLASRLTATVATITATLNIGGGTGNAIGTMNMATNTSTGASATSATATMNVSGGTTTVGTGSGNAITMANAGATAFGPANGTINLTGGTLTMAGNIIRNATSAGAENTTLTLNGGTLDMGGFSIGTAAKPVGSGTGALSFQAGTLRNVAQINGGAGLTKTTAGVLVLQGTNTYTGPTTVSAGELTMTAAFLDDTAAVTVATDAKINLNFTGSDQVGSLTLGALPPLPDGSYNATSHPAFFTGSGSIRVGAGGLTALEQWRFDNFGNSANTGNGADDFDFDFDGIDNLIEYATGTNPTTSNGSPTTVGQSGGFLTVTFNRIADPALIYTVKADNGLASFGTTIFTSTGVSNTAGPVVATDTQPIAGNPKRFARLEVKY